MIDADNRYVKLDQPLWVGPHHSNGESGFFIGQQKGSRIAYNTDEVVYASYIASEGLYHVSKAGGPVVSVHGTYLRSASLTDILAVRLEGNV